MPTEVATLCFHTRDAVERDDSKLTFEMPSNRLRTPAAKVALASCEFPMVQWTVESDMNRLWLSEGVRLQGSEDPAYANNVLRIVAKRPATKHPAGQEALEQPVCLTLPPRLNPIVSVTRKGTVLVCKCAHPHGLWSVHTNTPLGPAFSDGNVRLLGKGDISLSMALADNALEVRSETSFAVRTPRTDDDFLFVYTPTVASPKHLCEWLTVAARGALAGVRLAFTYDATKDLVVLRGAADEPGTLVRILPDRLALAMGLSTTPLRLVDTVPHTWPSEPTRLWDYVRIPPGFYAPCHRPMCVGQPLRLGMEMEAAVNRCYFPLSDRLPTGATTPHILVFSDPEGRTLTCPIPCGRYAPMQLCAHLETGMTRAAEVLSPGLVFSVAHDEDRFVFACERRDAVTGRVAPACFGLLFHHPLCVDASRFGFAPQPLGGGSSYTAAEETHAAVTGSGGRTVANVLRISEVVPQKRFRLHATTPPPMSGVVVAQNEEQGGRRMLSLRTYVNKLPFAHGYQVGDVVRLAKGGPMRFLRVKEQGDDENLEEIEVPETPAAIPADFSCVVADSGTASAALGGSDPCLLHVHIPARLGGIGDANTCLQIVCDAVEPWSFCTCKPQSLPAHLLGFPERAILWGVDGSVAEAGGARRFPPYDAPYTHCLDHPDYVLLCFSEQGGTSLEHSYGGENRHVFCKLSLYPLFREERMLPRDTMLLGNNLSRFTLSFWNPDLRTPYHFHGAQFSFSLSFFSAIPDALPPPS